VALLCSPGWYEVLFIVMSVVVGFLCTCISLFKMFRSRYDIRLFLSSVIVNCSALCCLLKWSNIDSGVILFWL
jgi:NO-binding membrane sensor protein with MHYT domain